MNERKAKSIRKQLFQEGISIQAEPYEGDRTKVASKGRRIYKLRKKL
jgi:hypothetical protein